MNAQRGQTSAEVAGILVLIAAVVGALSGLGLPQRVGGEAKAAVCRVLDGECAAQTPAPGTDTVPVSTTTEAGGDGSDVPPGWPTDGPRLGDRPDDFPVLPFPGSVGASGEAGRTRASGSITRSDDGLNADGCPTATLGVDGRVEVFGGTSAKRNGKGAGTENATGVGVDYGVTVSPERADAIEAGDEPPPDPIDPDSLEVGEGIELGESYYEKAGLSGNYRALQASMGFESGRRLSSGVSRIGEDTVRISVGDSDDVRQSLAAGLGRDGIKVQFGASTTQSQGKLSTIDVDVSTEAGWNAYQRFVSSGTLPRPGSAGTSDPRTADTYDLSTESSIGAEVGGFSASVPISDASGSRTETRNPDGTTDYAINAQRGSRGFQILDYGDPSREDLYALNFEGVDDAGVDYYNDVNGSGLSEFEDGVRVEYTEDELYDMQAAAVDVYQGLADEQGLEVPSDEEVLSGFTYGEAPTDDASMVNLATAPGLVEPLLEAETPGDILIALESGRGTGSASDAFAEIADLAAATSRYRGDDPRDAPILPGDSVLPDCG